MKLTIQQLIIAQKEIENLLGNKLYEEVFRKYNQVDNDIKEMRYIISESNKYDREIIAEFYASFAYFLFNSSDYDQFFEMYIMAQNYGYSSQKRRQFLYEAFIEFNLNDFRSNYVKNLEQMKALGGIEEVIEFEELPYWLITTGNENEYYLYDKESDLIKEKFKFELSEDNPQNEFNINNSDYLIINIDSLPKIQSYIKDISLKGKTAYIIGNNIEKLLSCFQGGIISELFLYKFVVFNNIDTLKKYFKNRNNYLPRQIIGSDEEKFEYEKVIEEIHISRLKKEKRFGDNILLSICIPSYNRGKRAYDNIMHTLKSDFDEEIEIVLSNNGTKNKSRVFYDRISQIEDARLTYFEFDENQGFALNLCKVVDLAKGKYVLLLSDEDFVDLNKLKLIISILSFENNIAIIRTKTDGQGIVPFIGMTEKGKDSLYNFMLTSNYMSGIIFNKELIRRYNLVEYIERNLDNETCYSYPHMVWELILCQYGKVLGLDIVFINEGQPEKTEDDLTKIGLNEQKTIPHYATLEGRINQHRGFSEVIKEMEISRNDFDTFRELYKRLCAKTLFLVSLSIRVFYKETDVDTDELMQSAYNESVKLLDEMYYGKKNRNKYKYTEDLAEIKKYYQNSKSQCK